MWILRYLVTFEFMLTSFPHWRRFSILQTELQSHLLSLTTKSLVFPELKRTVISPSVWLKLAIKFKHDSLQKRAQLIADHIDSQSSKATLIITGNWEKTQE